MAEIRQTGLSQGDLVQYLYTALDMLGSRSILPAALQGGTSIGSQQIRALSNTAANSTLVYQIQGTLYAAATTEVAFTATTHDVAVNKERNFTVAINANGTCWLYVGDEQPTGYASFADDVPSTQAVLGYVTILAGATTAFTAGTTTLDSSATTTGITVTYTNVGFDPYKMDWLGDNLVLA